MSFRWTIKLPQGPCLAILLGVVAFFLITGGKILWPTNTNWLMAGDPAQHWIGWQYFRYTPLLQWPIGANPDLGMEISSSIVFTDSIPLMAFLFKPLNALLPDTFQYTGLWILICFSLQSFFAWKLLSLFTEDIYLPLIGSVFFIIAPIGLAKLCAGHYALFGHWVLLAGIYLYFAKVFSIFRWLSLLAAATLIHAYLLVMVLAIWSADLIQRCCLKHVSILKALIYFFAGSISVAIVMWVAGYFMVGKDIGFIGFGYLRMNLLAFIDPQDMYSKLLPALKTASPFDDTEGFNFLGLGMLGLGFIASYILLRNIKIIPKTIPKAKLIPILIISLGLFLYAISNRIAIGPYELLSYPLPPITDILTSTFRCSGRFFWPVYYVIYLAIFYLLFTRLKRSIAITLCVVTLFVQLIDSKDAWSTFRYQSARSSDGQSPTHSPIWSDIARQYGKIIVIQPQNGLDNWISSFVAHQYWEIIVTLPQNGPTLWIALFAATHRMAINIGLFARTNPEREHKAKEHIVTAILSNELDRDSLYVFENDALWRIASNRIGPSDVAGILDGYRIIAPKLRECKTCNLNTIASIPAGESHILDYKMERLSFKLNGNGQKYQVYGWSEAEEGGTWSDGDVSSILLPLSITPKNNLELMLDGHAFIGDKHPSQEVGILVNGHHLATLKYAQPSNGGVRVVKIPRSLVLEKNGQLLIKFIIKNPKSPFELGLSMDARRLGLCLTSLKLRAVD